MYRFALVSEGWTDVAVVENIVHGVLGDKAVINPLMPLRDETDSSRHSDQNFSNWQLVLEYISTDQVKIALATNDYLIIHIDTDMGDYPEFGLQLTENGHTKPVTQIVEECRQQLINRLPEDISECDRSRIIFAVPVLTTECWLVALHNSLHNHSSSKANNCEQRLLTTLRGRYKVKKDYQCYQALSKGFRKLKILKSTLQRVPCLELFVASTPSS